MLFEAVTKQAVPIETRKTVAGTEARADGRRSLVFAHGERSAPFDLVVDALGSSSPLCPPSGRPLPYGALWAGLDWPNGGSLDTTALEQRYVGAHTMVGVMPMGLPDGFAANQAAFFWSLREDRFDEWRAGGLALWKDRVAALWPATLPLLDQIDDPERLIFARYRHRTLAHPTETGLIHIGDAWRSNSPQLGQGANMALLDAYALAMAIRAEPDVESALARAVRARRAHVMTYQAMSRLFTPVYQSDSRMLPILRDRLVGPLSKVWPATTILAMIVSGLLAAPLGKLGLRTF